ncbi:50S ribosomal protein L22 [Candidatus Daviesbacteria bacterium]|nr:50S ribosomal protein L22 [Candidatus Daviesbacteria bacterium]
MEVQTIQRYIHTSPRKLRLVSDMVRKMEPEKVLDILRVTPKSAAKVLAGAIKTVLANAKQQGMDTSKITFKLLEINESMKMRRLRAGTRGRAKQYKRRMSHIKIILTDDLNLKPQNSKLKKRKGGKQIEVVMDNSAESAK